MPEISAPFPEEPRRIMRPDRTALLLHVQGVRMDLLAAYGELLETMIFARTTVACDEKLLLKYCRTLKSNEAHNVLSIIWKESTFVTAEALAQAGVGREYQGTDLTAHRLAVDLCERPQDVSKVNSRVRNIAIAAASFHLVDRTLAHSTKTVMSGTRTLHEFMTELNSVNIKTLASLLPILHSVSSESLSFDGETNNE
jgi:hypothetical protein